MSEDTSVDSQYSYSLGNLKGLTMAGVKQIILDILNLILQYTVSDLKEWVNVKVPKATGALRQTIIASLDKSTVYGGKVILVFGSDLDYADYVNDFSTSQVAHSGEQRYVYKGLPPITLNDPDAVGNWFDEMKLYAIERLTYNSDTITRYILGSVANIVQGSIKDMS